MKYQPSNLSKFGALDDPMYSKGLISCKYDTTTSATRLTDQPRRKVNFHICCCLRLSMPSTYTFIVSVLFLTFAFHRTYPSSLKHG